jgi:hypothetical protein
VSCVTLMANRSDRRFQTLSPRMAARGRQTDQQNEARGNPSRPGLHLTPDKQAGYMTATVFQIASAIQPLTGRGPYMRGGEVWIRTPGATRASMGGIRPEFGALYVDKKHPCWREVVRLEFGSETRVCPVAQRSAGAWLTQA